MASNEISVPVGYVKDDVSTSVSSDKGTQTSTNIRELRNEIRQVLEKGEEEVKKLHDRMSQLQTATQTVIKISQDSITFLKECNKLLKSADEKLE